MKIFTRDPNRIPTGVRDVLPFLYVVTVVMVGIYVVALTGLGPLRTTLRVVALTGLMLAYLAFFWGLLLLPEKIGAYVAFLIIQSVLAFALTLITRQAMLSVGLYSPLVGVAVGSLRNLRWSVIAVVGIVTLAVFSMYLLPDPNIPADWFLVIVPVMLFVIVYVELYSRQSEAREESQRLLKELESAHLQLSEYAAQVEDLTLANERQRVARELHDTLAQGLVGLILQLEATASHLQNGRHERAQEIVMQAMARARTTLADARKAIGNLREMQVLPDDLVEIIHTEVQRFTTATGIPCEVKTLSVVNVSERIAEHVQRIVAEALINVARHAQAQKAWVNMTSEEICLKIAIVDDGIGFDPDKKTPSSGQHYGLLGMRERARLAGGSLEITSAPGAGTTITLTLPLHVDQDGA